MKIATSSMLGRLFVGVVVGVVGGALALAAGGCSHESSDRAASPMAVKSMAQTPGKPARGQPLFDTDQEAADALLAAVQAQDHDAVHRLLGPAWRELTSGDKVEDAQDFKDFSARSTEKMRLEKEGDDATWLRVGADDWLFPIPLVKSPNGKWFFDTETGKAQLLARRIGQNELDAIKICRLYIKAQREYASEDPQATGDIQYAQQIISTPGKRDGLYWQTSGEQQPSPLARLLDEARLDGYSPAPGRGAPNFGYRFRVLKRQGDNAPGGSMDYVNDGEMTGGFALIAYPVKYGSSGIMTFVVSQSGIVYEKNLGPNTRQIARHIRDYNPDNTWTLVKDQ